MKLSQVLVGNKSSHSVKFTPFLVGKTRMKDSDGDGVPNIWDCVPNDPKRDSTLPNRISKIKRPEDNKPKFSGSLTQSKVDQKTGQETKIETRYIVDGKTVGRIKYGSGGASYETTKDLPSEGYVIDTASGERAILKQEQATLQSKPSAQNITQNLELSRSDLQSRQPQKQETNYKVVLPELTKVNAPSQKVTTGDQRQEFAFIQNKKPNTGLVTDTLNLFAEKIPQKIGQATTYAIKSSPLGYEEKEVRAINPPSGKEVISAIKQGRSIPKGKEVNYTLTAEDIGKSTEEVTKTAVLFTPYLGEAVAVKSGYESIKVLNKANKYQSSEDKYAAGLNLAMLGVGFGAYGLTKTYTYLNKPYNVEVQYPKYSQTRTGSDVVVQGEKFIGQGRKFTVDIQPTATGNVPYYQYLKAKATTGKLEVPLSKLDVKADVNIKIDTFNLAGEKGRGTSVSKTKKLGEGQTLIKEQQTLVESKPVKVETGKELKGEAQYLNKNLPARTGVDSTKTYASISKNIEGKSIGTKRIVNEEGTMVDFFPARRVRTSQTQQQFKLGDLPQQTYSKSLTRVNRVGKIGEREIFAVESASKTTLKPRGIARGNVELEQGFVSIRRLREPPEVTRLGKVSKSQKRLRQIQKQETEQLVAQVQSLTPKRTSTTKKSFTISSQLEKPTNAFSVPLRSKSLYYGVGGLRSNVQEAEGIFSFNRFSLGTMGIQKPKERGRDETILLNFGVLGTDQVPTQITPEQQRPRDEQVIIQPPGLVPRLETSSIPATEQVPDLFIPPTPTPTRPREPTTPKEPPTKIIPDLTFPGEKKLTEQGYDAYAYVDATKRNKAYYRKLNTQPLTQESALSLTAREVDNTISAKGKVVKRKPVKKSGRQIKATVMNTGDRYYSENQFKFRNYSGRKMRPLPTGTIIEKRKYRLDSSGEVGKIQRDKARSVRGIFGI